MNISIGLLLPCAIAALCIAGCSRKGASFCGTKAVVDDSSRSAVTIDFGGSVGLAYDPPCIRVKPGTAVTFSGNFAIHPLAGGDSPPTVDTSSPIKETKGGSSMTFTLTKPGTYDYFCEAHYAPNRMEGMIVVQ